MQGRLRGLGVTIVMPAGSTPEREQLMRLFGADVIYSPAELGSNGAVTMARELADADPTLFMPFQYGNPRTRARTSAARPRRSSRVLPEVDVFVAGLGTGGTLMGCARRLRRDRPDLQVVAAEPLPGEGIDGLRSLEDGYTPEILDLSLLDRKLLVSNEDSVRGLRALAREEGLFAGVSSGGVLHAAMRVARDLDGPANIVMVLADGGWKYLSAGLWDTPEDELARAHGAGRLVVDGSPRALADEMIAHARSELPNEACGIFGGTLDGELRTFYPARNADASPYRYSVDADGPAAHRARRSTTRGDEVAAIYHSHTMSPASPSRTDMELATWPEAAYLIVSLKSDPPEIRAWRLRRGQAARGAPARDRLGADARPRRAARARRRRASRRAGSARATSQRASGTRKRSSTPLSP